jgi:phosphopantothenoylcysteine synthetase/decarboxylase
MAMQDPEIMQMQQQMQMMQQQAMQNPAMQQQLQQMQQQMMLVVEDKVAQLTTQILQELAPQFAMPNQEDPLVGLRKEELDIKAADINRKASEGQQRIDLERRRIDNQEDIGDERLAAQVAIADMKNDTAQDRIDVARQQQMAKTAENMAKNFFGGR